MHKNHGGKLVKNVDSWALHPRNSGSVGAKIALDYTFLKHTTEAGGHTLSIIILSPLN